MIDKDRDWWQRVLDDAMDEMFEENNSPESEVEYPCDIVTRLPWRSPELRRGCNKRD